MKLKLKGITIKEFLDYCQDIEDNMESETTYYGQIDEKIPYSEELRVRHIYGVEKNEEVSVFYVENFDEENYNITYDIYEE